jgi:hypothetical protein
MSAVETNEEYYSQIPVVKNESSTKTNTRMVLVLLCIIFISVMICKCGNTSKQSCFKYNKKENFNYINKSINSKKHVTNKSVLCKYIKIINKTGDIPIKKINIITDKNVLFSYDLATNTHKQITDDVNIKYNKDGSGIIISLELPEEKNVSEIIIESDPVDIRYNNLEYTKVYIRDKNNNITWESKYFLEKKQHNSLRVYEDRIIYKINIEQPIETMPKYVDSYVESDPKKYDDEDRMFHLVH